jgi:hypothetical protein
VQSFSPTLIFLFPSVLQTENAELRKGKMGKIKDKKYDDIPDTVSDFSEMTEESNITAQENILDLAIDSGEFYGNSLVEVLGKSKIKEESFNTFIAISFYDHETKATDIVAGFGPMYATQFAFRNRFDDFYLDYLDSQVLKLEVYLSKAENAEIIGVANILLRELLQLNHRDASKSKVVSSITDIVSTAKEDVTIGSIKFKMRLRLNANQAIKFFLEKKNEVQLERTKDEDKQRKAITFQIVECRDLKVKHVKPDKMKPF